ncbi:hypothetical protein EVAR_103108_1 [Eumeta japonica]|uniref:Retrovirus-related Pol polyprotein from transposon TNT 1-94 n=1 Tax=Eumeta variegata TaxID=151549 RepID=A0A4C1X1F6_EUMVA|nr:hypothetical protein EVAR_103108_1 [Eumeta japonica]
MFDDSGFSRRITLLRNLISIRLDGCDSMSTYITQIIETAQKLAGTGFPVNDEWIGCLLLAGLPEKYFPMIMAIEHSGIAITADVIKTKLIDLSDDSSEAGNAFSAEGSTIVNIAMFAIRKRMTVLVATMAPPAAVRQVRTKRNR